jgi:hypothetical protein
MHRFDYSIDRREGGGSTIRYVHSGALSGDWEAEYEAMSEGDPMYLAKLAEYITYFSGRFATSIDAHGPEVPDRDRALATFRHALGLGDDAAVDDKVRPRCRRRSSRTSSWASASGRGRTACTRRSASG